MTRRYSLNSKIDALNQIDHFDGDVALVSNAAAIPSRTLQNWLRQEDDLRRRYRQRQIRQRERLKVNLQLEMLERGKSILAQMDDETLEKAPLNQLAAALSSLVSQALKLEEVIGDIDEAEERVIRHEFFYDGQVQDAPPWAGASAGSPRAVQGGRLREALGQNGAGQNDAAASGIGGAETGLVAGADLLDGEPGLARLEDKRQVS